MMPGKSRLRGRRCPLKAPPAAVGPMQSPWPQIRFEPSGRAVDASGPPLLARNRTKSRHPHRGRLWRSRSVRQVPRTAGARNSRNPAHGRRRNPSWPGAPGGRLPPGLPDGASGIHECGGGRSPGPDLIRRRGAASLAACRPAGRFSDGSARPGPGPPAGAKFVGRDHPGRKRCRRPQAWSTAAGAFGPDFSPRIVPGAGPCGATIAFWAWLPPAVRSWAWLWIWARPRWPRP